MTTSPKLDMLSFGMVISDGIATPLSFTKKFCLQEGGHGCFLEGRLGFFLRFLCFIIETNIQVNETYLS